MDPRFKTSFIPKQEVAMLSNRPASGFRYSIFAIVAFSVFILSVILAITAVLYQRSLVSTLNKMNAELIAAKESFDPALVAELIKLDKKIEAAKELLNKHSTVSPIFDLLEKETLQGVRFSNFNYELDAKGQPVISMKGETSNFAAVALQSDVFSASSRIKSPVFSGLNLDDKGVASFNFRGVLDGQSLLYKNIIVPTKTGGANDNSENNIEITPAN